MTKPTTLGTLQCPSSFDRSGTFLAKVACTISSMLDDLQLDIALRIHERIYEFFSPWHYPLSLRNRHDARMHSVERKKKRQRLISRRRNGTRTPLPLHI